MGTVHGVYLKYVGLSALSYMGYAYLVTQEDGTKLTVLDLIGLGTKTVALSHNHHRRLVEASHGQSNVLLWKTLPALVLGYSTIVNGVIAILFKCEWGMGLIGKDRKTGHIPWWSYVVYFPFHIPTLLYTHLHTRLVTHKMPRADGSPSDGHYHRVPVATQVQPGWWVGGCYAHELNKDWAAVIDLTVEFPEICIQRTASYLSIPTWDGVPCSALQLNEAADFAVAAKQQYGGDVLVHCAHGRGRSTTVMCACLVKAGLYNTWQEAFEKGIKPQRSVCKLNRRMRQVLTEWQELYVDDREKKEQ
jgi:protein-tyrosine phosphatase